MTPVRAIAFIAVPALLAACAPLSIYYREGVPVSRMQADQTTCEIKALQDVPPSIQIRQEPPQYYPARRICTEGGKCYVRPGGFIPGEVYSVDVNADLRARAEAMCMASKGYAPVTLPNCPPDIARSVPPAATRTLPRLTQGSCVIRNAGGSWQIVTPAP